MEATRKASSAPWATASRSQARHLFKHQPTLPHTRQGCRRLLGARSTVGLPWLARPRQTLGKTCCCQWAPPQMQARSTSHIPVQSRTGLWGRHCHLPPCSAGETDTRRNKMTCLRLERRCWDFHVAPRLGLSDPVSIRFRLSPLLPGRPVTGTSGGKAPTTLSSAPISEPLSLLLTVPALPSLLLTTLFPTGGQESWC